MSTKIFTPFLFILLVVVHRASARADCAWQGTAPACAGECPSSHPSRVAVGRGGCDNGDYCLTGQKVLCCTSSPGDNCQWYGSAPFCGGECPSGKYQVGASDDAGDGSTCATGCKVFCCDESADIEGISATFAEEQLVLV
ncbi:hypothetical protein B0H16DRAFT_1546163 [Mycena metata]|uniref:Uncharacterized protein n=1 Tax=Mycena metata TaxID=1033252 RepID=A0AAD7H446_9AGAR|nr:hypothetical protein B0H16DRAFT_1628470 [Mycena metata]KAJ7752686.1 hypothetical protein B0H16DRAFT_1546163 [Mycena metata]